MQILALTETSLYVRTFDDVVFDLATGVGEEVRDEPWREDVDELTSPDGEWRIERASEGPSRIVGTNGQAVTPSTKGPRWNLFGWADDRTAVGTYITGPNTGNRSKSGDSVALMSCAVPAGECQVFEETEGDGDLPCPLDPRPRDHPSMVPRSTPQFRLVRAHRRP